MGFWRRLSYFLAYFGRPPWDTGLTPPELQAFIQTHPPGRALDLGCGTGVNAMTLAQAGWQVIGVDFVPQAIHRARQRARQAGLVVDFRLEDVTQLRSVSGAFDLILDIGCFHSLSLAGKQAVSRRVNELLKPGGSFLMYGFYPRSDPKRPAITPEDLAQLTATLELVKMETGSERGRWPSAWITLQKPASR